MRVCVFGSSSRKTKESFLNASRELGVLLGKDGVTSVNGGGSTGCMGALNDACLSAGGEVTGIIHRMWVDEGDELHLGLVNLVIVDGDNLGERKELLLHGADCVIALPGGVGTMDELWQSISERQLGFSDRPIALLNTDGFYDCIWDTLVQLKDNGLLYKDPAELVFLAKTPAEALQYCKDHIAMRPGKIQKLRDRRTYTHGLITGSVLGAIAALAINFLRQ